MQVKIVSYMIIIGIVLWFSLLGYLAYSLLQDTDYTNYEPLIIQPQSSYHGYTVEEHLMHINKYEELSINCKKYVEKFGNLSSTDCKTLMAYSDVYDIGQVETIIKQLTDAQLKTMEMKLETINNNVNNIVNIIKATKRYGQVYSL